MTHSESKSLTPKEGCEKCKQLRSQVDSAREAKAYLIHGVGTGYRREKSRSRQYNYVRELMDSNEDAERLAQSELRLHEIEVHDGVTESNGREYVEHMTILLRGGRNKP